MVPLERSRHPPTSPSSSRSREKSPMPPCYRVTRILSQVAVWPAPPPAPRRSPRRRSSSVRSARRSAFEPQPQRRALTGTEPAGRAAEQARAASLAGVHPHDRAARPLGCGEPDHEAALREPRSERHGRAAPGGRERCGARDRPAPARLSARPRCDSTVTVVARRLRRYRAPWTGGRAERGRADVVRVRLLGRVAGGVDRERTTSVCEPTGRARSEAV